MQSSSEGNLKNYLGEKIGAIDLTLGEYLDQFVSFTENELLLGASILGNNIFESLQGEAASAAFIQDTFTVFYSSVDQYGKVANFSNNVSRAGSTITGVQAVIQMDLITMSNNFGV